VHYVTVISEGSYVIRAKVEDTVLYELYIDLSCTCNFWVQYFS